MLLLQAMQHNLLPAVVGLYSISSTGSSLQQAARTALLLLLLQPSATLSEVSKASCQAEIRAGTFCQASAITQQQAVAKHFSTAAVNACMQLLSQTGMSLLEELSFETAVIAEAVRCIQMMRTQSFN